jgi:putative IMPACT (imprinted ancient) family translation regulator
MAVVTRYYGGIKLGVPGLISAYSEATTLAIQNSTIVIREPMKIIDFKCAYGLYNILLDILKRYNVPASDITANFEEMIIGKLVIPEYDLDKIRFEFDGIKHCGSLFEYSTRG